MQALILAAGMGSRLDHFTKENTKCMLEVNDVKLIDRCIEQLIDVGIKKLILVVGYKKENLIEHLEKYRCGIEIAYVINEIYDTTNNIYSLYLARQYLQDDDTILIESDLIFDISILKNLISDARENLAVVSKFQNWMDGTSVTISNSDDITGYCTKENFDFKNIDDYYKTVNIYKLSKKYSTRNYIPFLEAYIKSRGKNEYYEAVLNVLSKTGNSDLKAKVLTKEKWYEIDDVQDLDNAEVIFSGSSEVKFDKLSRRYGGYWRFPELIDYCYLVNPYFPPAKLVDEISKNFKSLLIQYPSGLETQNLLAAKLFRIKQDNIIVGNGASEFIKVIGDCLDGTFGIVCPTFNEYYNTINKARIVEFIPQNEGFRYTLKELKILASKCDTLLLINPDNPSGNLINKVDLLELVQFTKQLGKNIIVDESFLDFVNEDERYTILEDRIIDENPHLIIIKSISKSYGVPGLRLGVLVTSNNQWLCKFKHSCSIWNINSFGEYFLQIYGKYRSEYKIACDNISVERERFYNELNSISFLQAYKSGANYLLCRITNDMSARLLSVKLVEKNILIKDLTGKVGIPGDKYLRLAVRDKHDNDIVLSELKRFK